MPPAPALARPVPGSPARTRERLLEAAERLFAERGFRATSVRALTSEARCNVASVNYHFGGKEGLYREMFRRRLVVLREQRIAGIRRAMDEAGGGASLEVTLGAFTRASSLRRRRPAHMRRLSLFARPPKLPWTQRSPHLLVTGLATMIRSSLP